MPIVVPSDISSPLLWDAVPRMLQWLRGKAEELQTHTPGPVCQDLNYVVLFLFILLS